MISYKKKHKIFIFYVPILALLVSFCIPAISIKAANWSSDKIKPGTTILAEGDTITCKDTAQITIHYHSNEEKFLFEQKSEENGKITILQQSEQSTGNIYKRYTVNSVTRSENELQISLTGIAVPVYKLEYLLIKKEPNKTAYSEGESFDKNGMIVIACYNNETLRQLKNGEYTVSPSGALTTDTTQVKISFTDDNNISKSVTQNITVKANQDDQDENNTSTNNQNYSANANFSNNSNSTQSQNNATKRKLTVVGSFAGESGAGSYVSGTKVTVNAGFVSGFTFAGWVASNGIIYPMPAMSYTMPDYDVLLYANWIPAGAPNTLSPITTTNLNGQQLTSWGDITNKLASFNVNDVNQPDSPVMKVAAGGLNCYIDAAPIAMLNTRQGIALDVSYGNDASFTFYSDTDNSQFTGADFTYTCSTATNLFLHEKNLIFTQPGAINTVICLNVSLPDAQSGQIAYVYHVNEKGTESMYLPAIVDAENKITIPIIEKFNLCIKY